MMKRTDEIPLELDVAKEETDFWKMEIGDMETQESH